MFTAQLGMLTIQPIKMLTTGGWFMKFVYPHYSQYNDIIVIIIVTMKMIIYCSDDLICIDIKYY